MPLRNHFRRPLDNIRPNRSISGLRSAAPNRSRLSLEARRRLLAPETWHMDSPLASPCRHYRCGSPIIWLCPWSWR